MKVGTDGVLLGAWSSLSHQPESILDIGSGTGLIALMMAQRSDAMTIDGVEVDESAYEQSVENFEQSEWGDRLFCYHSNFQDFAQEMGDDEESYDLIISNPPFYTEEYETQNDARNKARFVSSLSFEELISGASKLLSESGILSVIIPNKEEISFVKSAEKYKLFLNRVCRVKGTASSKFKRSLLEFSRKEIEIIEEELTIEITRHQYTQEYIDLTKDFYLKM